MNWSETIGAALTYRSDAAADASTSKKWPSLGQQRADALVALAEGTVSPGDLTTEVVVHVRGNGCSLDDGTQITDSEVAQLLPHVFIRTLIHDAERNPITASGK